MTISRPLIALAAIVLFSSTQSRAVAQAPKAEKLPPNAQLSTDAFKALNAKDYKKAIEIADECVFQFSAQALRDQKALENAGTKPPGTGHLSPSDHSTTIAMGVLNDVAACQFIKGEAFRYLKKRSEAESAYAAASVLTYARVYDPAQDIFWDPAQTAKDRIEALNRK